MLVRLRCFGIEEVMVPFLHALLLALPQDPTGQAPILRVGETLEGEITDADPVVHTPTLDERYSEAPTVGKTFQLAVEEPGTYTLELRSYLFDAYIVLREESGLPLAEDDDGLLGTHSRIVVRLEPGIRRIDACALHGQRGPFELAVQSGRPPDLSPVERAQLQRADLERALAAVETARGPEHPDTARSLNNLAELARIQGDYATAQPLYERALLICEEVFGTEHPTSAIVLNNLGSLLSAQGKYAESRLLHERALTIRERIRGPEHQDTAQSLNSLAGLLQVQGDYGGARPLFERALAINEKTLGSEHPDTATALSNLGNLLQIQGDFAAARPLYERALTISEKAPGPNLHTATTLSNLAVMLQAQGDYAVARSLFERALAIREEALGPQHAGTAEILNNLARLLKTQGDFAAARHMYQRALSIDETALGRDHPDVARDINNLGSLLQTQGDYAAARPLLERALSICQVTFGPQHPNTATALNNLAGLFKDQGDYVAAQPLYERALAIRQEALGSQDTGTAVILTNLSGLLLVKGDVAAAWPVAERALAICEEALGPAHPETATCLHNLASVLRAQGAFTAARHYYERAIAIREEALGPDHPDTVKTRSHLSILCADLGVREESWRFALSALRICVRNAENTLWSLSERERLSYLGLGEEALRSCFADSVLSALGESYELALAWRGLVSRSLLASRAQLRASLQDDAVAAIENLSGVQAELSKRLYATAIPDRERHEREIRELRAERNALEVKIQGLSGPSLARAPSLAELEHSLDPSEAFLDFLVHPLYRPAELEDQMVVRRGEWTEDHLSAWIVRRDHELVHLDLGLAAPIEAAVRRWLAEIVSRRGGAVVEGATHDAGARLCDLLWQPLSASLEGVERVFVRPDSFLGTLPFGIIRLADDRYLIEEKDFVYVQVPEDSARAQERSTGTSFLAVGGVDFKKRGELEPDSALATPTFASASLTDELRGHLNEFWSRLPYTENEAQTVNDLFEVSTTGGERLLLTGDQPTEERLKRELPRHAFVHLATHGFFHPAGTVSLWDSAREATSKGELRGLEQETRGLVGELPGLLSGLVCAGANEPVPAGRDDGLLTAEEVLWLDLSQVELVVLSACETALGERRSGEGMIGLRRAFGLAGAKTVVSSLWSVKDRSTSELMQRFYENLLVRQQGRSEALRNAQLALLAENRATEQDALPSTWGAFVLSGEWR